MTMLYNLLLKSASFTELLKAHSISFDSFVIKDEDVILSQINMSKSQPFKERVVIEGSGINGACNFIGILHCNFEKNIAVFELDCIAK